jgi:hypothetical protein
VNNYLESKIDILAEGNKKMVEDIKMMAEGNKRMDDKINKS